MKTNILDSHKLEYEEMEFRVPKPKVSKPAVNTSVSAVKKKKLSLKERFNVARFKASMKRRGAASRSGFNDIKNRIRPPKKPLKLSQKAQLERKKAARQQQLHGIIGIGLLFVVVSIAYSTYVVRTFVNSTASLVALAPQVIFAAIILLIAFYKIYK